MEKEFRVTQDYHIEIGVMKYIEVDFLVEDKLLLETLHSANIQYANSVINDAFLRFQIAKKYSPKYHRVAIYNDNSQIADASRFSYLHEVIDVDPIPWSEREGKIEYILASI